MTNITTMKETRWYHIRMTDPLSREFEFIIAFQGNRCTTASSMFAWMVGMTKPFIKEWLKQRNAVINTISEEDMRDFIRNNGVSHEKQ